MVRYSHVALTILVEDPGGKEVSQYLGVLPTCVRESKGFRRNRSEAPLEAYTSYTWSFDSKKDISHQPIVRIHALLDEVELFSERLLSLDAKYHRWIDMLFHVTPQHSHGITGEFDWLSLPPKTMERIAKLQLSLSYEVFWLDHPDWRLPWHKRLLRKLKRPNQSPATVFKNPVESAGF